MQVTLAYTNGGRGLLRESCVECVGTWWQRSKSLLRPLHDSVGPLHSPQQISRQTLFNTLGFSLPIFSSDKPPFVRLLIGPTHFPPCCFSIISAITVPTKVPQMYLCTQARTCMSHGHTNTQRKHLCNQFGRKVYRLTPSVHGGVLHTIAHLWLCFLLAGSPRELISRLAVQRSASAGADWYNSRYATRSTELWYSYRFVCEDNYYGARCEDLCRPRDDQFGHYYCSDNGTKICKDGWQGEYCDRGE